MATTVYVDIRGDDREHADHLAGTVRMLARGFGLAQHGQADAWWGGGAEYPVDLEATTVRLAITMPGPGSASHLADRLVAFLAANLWVYHGHLLAVFIEGRATAVYGEVRGIGALADYAEALAA